jgi:hypothetical protein
MSVEIVAPFREAWQKTRQLLFEPFDLQKWLCLGLCAYLASMTQGLGSGGGGNSNFEKGKGEWSHPTAEKIHGWLGSIQPWVWALIALGVVMIVALSVVFMWLSARGKFMWLDNLVRQTGEVRAPWREFRALGNRLFRFTLGWGVVAVVTSLVAVCLAVVAIIPVFDQIVVNRNPQAVLWVALVITLVAFVIVNWAFLFSIVADFAVPIMYRRECGPWEATKDAIILLIRYPVDFVLYYLFYSLLLIALVVIVLVVSCATCCIAFLALLIPVIGTTLMLPLLAPLRYYSFLFLRQYGDAYDVYRRPALAPAPPPLPV